MPEPVLKLSELMVANDDFCHVWQVEGWNCRLHEMLSGLRQKSLLREKASASVQRKYNRVLI
jgi:hypothetical protein